MFAALAGILYACRSDAANPAAGQNWLMGAITAAILGGTSLRGGQGSIVGAVLGALLLAVLANGMVPMNVSGIWQRVIVGLWCRWRCWSTSCGGASDGRCARNGRMDRCGGVGRSPDGGHRVA